MADTSGAGTAGDGPREIVAAVGDLIFTARIRGVADQVGVPVHFSRSADDLQAKAAGARMVLIDLDARWLDGPAAIRRLRQEPASAQVSVLAFVSHVRTAAIEAAREAGADRILARSAFVRDLARILAG